MSEFQNRLYPQAKNAGPAALHALFVVLISLVLVDIGVAEQFFVSGQVKDKAGVAVSNATVRVEKTHHPSESYVTSTDDSGRYSIFFETGIRDVQNRADGWFLSRNYPNPFNPMTSLNYGVEGPSYVSLVILDAKGRRIVSLVSRHQAAGSYTVSWDGKDSQGKETPSGIYFAAMRAGDFFETKKLTKVNGIADSPGVHVESSSAGTGLSKTLSNIINIIVSKPGEISEARRDGYALAGNEVIHFTVNKIPRYFEFPMVRTYPNHTVILDNAQNIYDPDDNLEDLIIAVKDSSLAVAEGMNGNSRLKVHLVENFKGDRSVPLLISDGTEMIEGAIPFNTEGMLFRTRAVHWKDMQPVQERLFIIAKNNDPSDTTEYGASSSTGELNIYVKPGNYNLYVRDELEKFELDPYQAFWSEDRQATLEEQKPEWLKIGKWYDRLIEGADVTWDITWPDQMLIQAGVDLSDGPKYKAYYGTILSKFDYPSYLWMVAGYDYWHFKTVGGEQIIVPEGFAYNKTGQEISEIKEPAPRWPEFSRGEKVIVYQNPDWQKNIVPFQDEQNNIHAVETYLEAEREILEGLNPDWFDIRNQNSGPGSSFIEIRYKADLTQPEMYRDENIIRDNDLVIMKFGIPSQISKDYTYDQKDEAKQQIRKNLMANMMELMGMPGRLNVWLYYIAAYRRSDGVKRAAGELKKASETYGDTVPSEWDIRDKNAILYHSLTNDRDPTHVLVD